MNQENVENESTSFGGVINPAVKQPAPLPEHGSCFVCGCQNPKGMGLVWYAQNDGAASRLDPDGAERSNILVYSEFRFTLAEQGPPGYAHGGASAAVIDEAMGAAVWRSGLKVVLANLNLDYRLPTPLDMPLRVEGWLKRREGRKAYAHGRILLPDGRVTVEGTGLFVHAPQLYEFGYYG